ncbi:hypothetical protein R3P38DRAFT_2729518, partial [Favolaschia claudopus]
MAAAFHRIPLQLHYPNEDQPLKIIMARIPAVMPTPYLFPGSYLYLGRSFTQLPSEIQSFVTSCGLNDPRQYTSADVAAVCRTYTEQFIELTQPTCERIVQIQMYWNLLSNVCLPQMQHCIMTYHPIMAWLIRLQRDEAIPALLEQVKEYLLYADALVWADIALRERTPDAASFHEISHHRHLQIQPVMNRIVNFITELYAWVAKMWEDGWSVDGNATYLRVEPSPRLQKVLEHDMPVVFPPVLTLVSGPRIGAMSPPPVYDAPLTSTPVIESRTLSPVTPPSARGVTVASPPFSPRSP